MKNGCNTGIENVPEKIIRIGGLATRYDLDWLYTYASKPGYKILICHHPEYYRRYIKDTEWDTFDLIVSGACPWRTVADWTAWRAGTGTGIAPQILLWML